MTVLQRYIFFVNIVAVLLILESCSTQVIQPDPIHHYDGPLPSKYIDYLIAKAKALQLAESTQWLRLGHWRMGIMGRGFQGGGYVSEADAPGFFLSRNGKLDPEAELEETIRGFFRSPNPNEKVTDTSRPPEHPMCRFPARFFYLNQALGIDTKYLKVKSCPRFSQFVQELQPISVTMIFSSYYLNNPASAFGHTFLRINRAPDQSMGKRRELLDYGIDFSATVDTTNAVIYALKGILGLFPGYFRRLPYYYKVREYNDYESRDIWEYDLQLSPLELTMLVAHIWEMGATYFDYYYFSENCSYHILGLLEVASERIRLLDHIESPVIPSETVKALYKNPGLVKAVHFRPSLRTQFRHRIESLNSEQRDYVELLSREPQTLFPEEWLDELRIRVLDAAIDWIDILYVEELIKKTDSNAANLKQVLMERRAEILKPSEPLLIDTPRESMPHLGHGSRRLGFGYTLDSSQIHWLGLDLRMALHDLADPTLGYPNHAQIEFLPLRLRVSTEDSRVYLDDFAVVRVVSLNAMEQFNQNPSWKVSVGALTRKDSGCDECVVFNATFGGGVAKAWWKKALTLFAMADVCVETGPHLEGISRAPIRAGLGPSLGFRLRLHRRLLSLFSGEWIWLPAQTPFAIWNATSIIRWEIVKDFALSLEVKFGNQTLFGQALTMVYF